MRSQTAYLVVMMVMMACFAVFRLDERALVLKAGNLLVTGSLLLGAVAVGLNKPFSLPIGLLAAGLTALMGIVGMATQRDGSALLRLPGYPLIWVVIGLYIAFRLVINHQQQQRAARHREADDAEGSAGGEA